jgi:hypothetical protein
MREVEKEGEEERKDTCSWRESINEDERFSMNLHF